MKAVALLLITLTGAAPTALAQAPATSHFRFVRPVLNAPASPAQTCLVLDARTFAHAAPGLSDLRLFDGDTEAPYAIRTAAPLEAGAAALDPLNLGTRNGRVSFDLQMPGDSYSDLDLDVSAHDFIASVTVSGGQTETTAGETKLGTFTIFDLSSQKLGRSTVLHLPASDFKFLHLEISGPLKPTQIESASVVRDPVTQTPYTAVAQTSTVRQQGHASVIEFTVPANVPVDRVLFAVGNQPVDFTRNVTVTITPAADPHPTDESEPPQPTILSGNLLRLHRTEDGQNIDEKRLTVDTYNQVSSRPTKWLISVDNGDDPPLALVSVLLQMQQRQLCFQRSSQNANQAQSAYSLFYGDSSLPSPRYDYATLFTPQKNPATAMLGPEQQNPAYQPPPDERPFTDRHPALLWIALVVVLAVLGIVALRSMTVSKPGS